MVTLSRLNECVRTRFLNFFSFICFALGAMILGSSVYEQNAAADCSRLAEIHAFLGFGDEGYPRFEGSEGADTTNTPRYFPMKDAREKFETDMIQHISGLGDQVCLKDQLAYVLPEKLGRYRSSNEVFFPNARVDDVIRAVTDAKYVSQWQGVQFSDGDPSIYPELNFWGLGYSRTTNSGQRKWMTPLVEEKNIVFYRFLEGPVYIMYRIPTDKGLSFDYFNHVGEFIIVPGSKYDLVQNQISNGVWLYWNRRFDTHGKWRLFSNASFVSAIVDPGMMKRLKEVVRKLGQFAAAPVGTPLSLPSGGMVEISDDEAQSSYANVPL